MLSKVEVRLSFFFFFVSHRPPLSIAPLLPLSSQLEFWLEHSRVQQAVKFTTTKR